MYSITMLSLYFSFYSSFFLRLSPSSFLSPLCVSLFLLLSLLPPPPPPPFALKTVRILLSCCLDLTQPIYSRRTASGCFSPDRRYRRDNIVALSEDAPRRREFSSTTRDQCATNCPLINHTHVQLGITGIINDFILPYTCFFLSRRERDDVVSLSRTMSRRRHAAPTK